MLSHLGCESIDSANVQRYNWIYGNANPTHHLTEFQQKQQTATYVIMFHSASNVNEAKQSHKFSASAPARAHAEQINMRKETEETLHSNIKIKYK